ncbi:hypothetical protein [Aneurinibacillus aneurinilyticus]|uniref:hypothetical protein n=1 Tax=Aneurinibacillus aneurinilyticus TaxID=1391 RepID=UPI003525B2A5
MYGTVGNLRTKFFYSYQNDEVEPGNRFDIDEKINKFLSDNPNIQVHEIKHSASISRIPGGHSTELVTALLIYRG